MKMPSQVKSPFRKKTEQRVRTERKKNEVAREIILGCSNKEKKISETTHSSGVCVFVAVAVAMEMSGRTNECEQSQTETKRQSEVNE